VRQGFIDRKNIGDFTHPEKERQLRVNLFLPQTAVVLSVWQAIEDFCLQKTGNLDKLYNCLEAPPFG